MQMSHQSITAQRYVIVQWLQNVPYHCIVYACLHLRILLGLQNIYTNTHILLVIHCC